MQDSKTGFFRVGLDLLCYAIVGYGEVWVRCVCGVVCVWWLWWVHPLYDEAETVLSLVLPSCCCGLAAKYDKMLREFGTLTRGVGERGRRGSSVENVRKCHR